MMRAIFAALALAHLRWALVEHGRAEMLDRHAAEAVASADALAARAEGFRLRAGLPSRQRRA